MVELETKIKKCCKNFSIIGEIFRLYQNNTIYMNILEWETVCEHSSLEQREIKNDKLFCPLCGKQLEIEKVFLGNLFDVF